MPQEGKSIEEIRDDASKYKGTVKSNERRIVKSDEHKSELLKRLSEDGQSPQVLFITCSDSRVAPNLITKTEEGDLFVIRNAGNIVPPHAKKANGMSASVEYAVAVLKVKHIVVCGHTGCGAMEGALDPSGLGAYPQVRGWLKQHAEAPLRTVDKQQPGLARDARLCALVKQNVLQQMANLQTHPCVKKRTATGKLQLHGWVYKIKSGDVLAWDANKKAFSPLVGGAGGANPSPGGGVPSPAAANEPPAVS